MRGKLRSCIFFAVSCLCAANTGIFADQILLKDGEILEGTITSETADSIVLATARGRRRISKARLQEIRLAQPYIEACLVPEGQAQLICGERVLRLADNRIYILEDGVYAAPSERRMNEYTEIVFSDLSPQDVSRHISAGTFVRIERRDGIALEGELEELDEAGHLGLDGVPLEDWGQTGLTLKVRPESGSSLRFRYGYLAPGLEQMWNGQALKGGSLAVLALGSLGGAVYHYSMGARARSSPNAEWIVFPWAGTYMVWSNPVASDFSQHRRANQAFGGALAFIYLLNALDLWFWITDSGGREPDTLSLSLIVGSGSLDSGAAFLPYNTSGPHDSAKSARPRDDFALNASLRLSF